jgi:hypothetical protein
MIPYFFRHRIIDGGEFISLTRRARFTPQGGFMAIISVTCQVIPRALAQLESLGKLKNKSIDTIGSHATFRLVQQYHNQLCYRVSPDDGYT